MFKLIGVLVALGGVVSNLTSIIGITFSLKLGTNSSRLLFSTSIDLGGGCSIASGTGLLGVTSTFDCFLTALGVPPAPLGGLWLF